jgi:hypothetical protein
MLTRGTRTPRARVGLGLALGAMLLAAVTMPEVRLHAQLPLQPVGSPFEMLGFIQKATLDNPNDVFSGGTITINDQLIVVPRNTILQMPATALTWAEVFKFAPPPYGPTQSGLALTDLPKPLTTYELTVQGNRIGDTYIAGLMFLSQHSAQIHQGFINFIDYATGEMRVGGTPGSATTGTRIRINDPLGKFGRASTPDGRFTIDEDNPTVRTETGYPMCLPRTRVDQGANDALCPQTNRPKDPATGAFRTIFTMPPPPAAAGQPDANLMVPFEIGDYITYNGTVFADAAGQYISCWGIIANLGIFTAPGTQPAYVAVDVLLMGTGPNNDLIVTQEGAKRTRVEGFTTDPSLPIDIFAMDVDPCTGNVTNRLWGTQGVDQGPPNGAKKGRWRFRPAAPLFDLKGFPFLPPTRMVQAISEGGVGPTTPNGIISGQYQLPNFQFIFPEQIPIGAAPVPENLETFQFLAQGSGPWFGGGSFTTALPQGIAGPLRPWPSVPVPATAACPAAAAPPVALARSTTPLDPVPSANRAVNSATVVTLTSAGSTGGTFSWQQISGPAVTLTDANTATARFTAPIVPVGGTQIGLQFLLTVGNGTFASTQTATVMVNPALPPTASAGAAQTVTAGGVVTLSGTGTDPNIPPLGALTLSWAQTGGTPLVTLTPTSAAGVSPATARFPAPQVPAGQASIVLTFTLTVGNGAPLLAGGMATATSTTTVTIVPPVPPVVTAGANQTVASGAALTLTGTVSDPNTPPLTDTSSWAQVVTAGQPTVTLTQGGTAAAPIATFTAPTVAPGAAPLTLTFRLTSTNTAGSTSATTNVTVNPATGLVVNAGAAQTVASGAAVTLSGTASDPNVPTLGAITSAWSTTAVGITLTQGGTPTARTATFVAPTIAAGQPSQTLTFTLTASNGAGTFTATTTVTVNPPPAGGLPPTVTAGANQTVASNAAVTLSGTASDPNTPPVGTLTSGWTQVLNAGDPAVTVTNGGTAGARTATCTVPIIPAGGAARTLTFQLTASNGAGSSTATTLVTVNPAKALTVSAGAARTVNSAAAVTLTGSVTDPNVPTLGAITSGWSTTTAGVTLTQGGTAAAPTVSFTAPATAQTMTFTLTSTNGAGPFTATTTVTVTAATPPPAGSLVAAWGFNEAAGVTTVGDSSGNGNTGTISGAARVASQAGHGNALSFNGTTDIVNVADSASLKLTTGMTLEAWVHPASLSATVASTVLLKQDITTGLSYALYANDPPNPSAYIRTGTTTPVVNATTNLPLNTWTHIAATYDGATMSFYVNGALVASHAQTGAIGTSFVQLTIGGNTVFGNGEHFNGLLDDIRIYNVALNEAQIQVDMTTAVP